MERRHAVLQKALEVYLADYGINGEKAVKQALAYIVPQINNTPSTSSFSPAQWLLGQSPDLPGELLGTSLTPVHRESFEDELARRATAKMAIIQESRPKLTRSSDEPCSGSMPVPTSCSYPDRNASFGATAGQQTL